MASRKLVHYLLFWVMIRHNFFTLQRVACSLDSSKQVKPGFTNYQPHPSTPWPEVKQKHAWKGEGSREKKEINISKLGNLNFEKKIKF